jgi:hypothetical protein
MRAASSGNIAEKEFYVFKIKAMKQIKTRTCFLVTASMLFLCGCANDAATSEASESDTTSVSATHSDTAVMPAYDPAMDPVTTGGQMIKQMGDSLGVKMYEFTVKPGESWGLHTHPDHTVYVLQGGKMALYMREAGRQDTLTFPTGMALVSGPLSDSGKNIGNTTIKMLVTDMYRPRAK